MKLVAESLVGPAIIRADTRLTGGCTGDLTVASGATLELDGDVAGNLMVCGGAQAIIKGAVHGTVFDEGGVVRVLGAVRRMWRSEQPRFV